MIVGAGWENISYDNSMSYDEYFQTLQREKGGGTYLRGVIVISILGGEEECLVLLSVPDHG